MVFRSGHENHQADTTKLYETLGIQKTASAKEIKTSYRKLVVVHHPDKGGDEHMIKEINAAYEILSDAEKRKRYDHHGLEGLASSFNEGGDKSSSSTSAADELFDLFFGRRTSHQQQSNSQSRRTAAQGEDQSQSISVTLEELYRGITVQLDLQRTVIVGEAVLCPVCEGARFKRELRNIGLGLVQQIQRPCEHCRGEGYLYQSQLENQVVDIHIKKGMRHQQTILLSGMADEKPGMIPGNLKVVLQEQPHPIFKRKGADLLTSRTVTLKEALCGVRWTLTHLDGRTLVITNRPGEIIQPFSAGGALPFTKFIPNEGMPSAENPFVRGNLYVRFTVTFLNDGDLGPEAIKALNLYLPGPTINLTSLDTDDNDDAEISYLQSSDVRNFGKGGIQNDKSSSYDSDDE